MLRCHGISSTTLRGTLWAQCPRRLSTSRRISPRLLDGTSYRPSLICTRSQKIYFDAVFRTQGRRFYSDKSQESRSSSRATIVAVFPAALVGICATCYGALEYARYLQKSGRHVRENRLFLRLRRNFFLTLENWQEGRWWTMFTSALMHANLLHLAVNMVAFWSFFPNMISLFGPVGAAGIAFLGQLGTSYGSLSWKYANISTLTPTAWGGQQNSQKIEGLNGEIWSLLGREPTKVSREHALKSTGSCGFSGVLCGAMAALATKEPRATVQLLFLPIYFPMWTAIGGLATYSWWAMCNSDSVMDDAGHLGGILGGLAGGILLRRFGSIKMGRVG